MPLFCPFPAVRNSATAWAEAHTSAWARSWGLLPTRATRQAFAEARFAELMGRAYPAAEPALLALIADWNSWTFLVDTQLDHHDLGRAPAQLGQFAAATQALLGDQPCRPEPGWPPLLHALADIVARLRTYGTPAWLARFRHNVGATLAHCVAEAACRQGGRLISEEEYLGVRPHTSGVYCFLDLIELAEGALLPDHVRAHPWLVLLTGLTTESIFLSNDLASAAKERLQGDGNNLVLIAERERGMTSAQAAAYVEARHNASVARFVAALRRPPSIDALTDELLHRYVSGLKAWMRANLDWSELTGRYRAPQYVAGHSLDRPAARAVGGHTDQQRGLLRAARGQDVAE